VGGLTAESRRRVYCGGGHEKIGSDWEPTEAPKLAELAIDKKLSQLL
jgi:hypothetical protein